MFKALLKIMQLGPLKILNLFKLPHILLFWQKTKRPLALPCTHQQPLLPPRMLQYICHYFQYSYESCSYNSSVVLTVVLIPSSIIGRVTAREGREESGITARGQCPPLFRIFLDWFLAGPYRRRSGIASWPERGVYPWRNPIGPFVQLMYASNTVYYGCRTAFATAYPTVHIGK